MKYVPLPDIRRTPDSAFLATLLAIAVAVAVGADYPDTVVWRAVPGAIAGGVLVVTLIRSGWLGPRGFVVGPSSGWPIMLTMWASALVCTVAFSGGATLWIGYIAVVAAANAPGGLATGVTLAAPVMGALAWRSFSLDHSGSTMLVNLMAAALAFVYVQTRRRRREAEELAAAQREVIEVERTRALAADHQREVAARLHDVLAHTLSGLIVTLQGASLMARQQQVAIELDDKLRTAVALARDGLHEARDAVESLREPVISTAEPIGDWLRRTVGRLSTATGLDVTVVGDPDLISPSWQNLARSVLMEGLTNSLRHAAEAPVRISIDGSEVTVVSDAGGRALVDREHPSGGHGLSGLAERVSAAGGLLRYGPTADGFTLNMRMTTNDGEGGTQ